MRVGPGRSDPQAEEETAREDVYRPERERVKLPPGDREGVMGESDRQRSEREGRPSRIIGDAIPE